MAKPEWVVNRDGVAKLLKSAEVRRDLERRAHAVAAAAGPGNEVSVELGPTRWRATVTTATHQARLNEARYRRLTRAVEAARR